MTLEEYKDKIRHYLEDSRIEKSLIDRLMKVYKKDIQEAYEKNWKVEEIAIPMILGL